VSLESVLALPQGPGRTAAIVAWLQGLYPRGREPVLVGGGAVELYTGGAYTTGDIDLVGAVPRAVALALEAAGFEPTGRHWVHEAGQVFLEFASAGLEAGEETARIRVGELEVLAVAPEDLLAERLSAWKHWRSMVDGVNAWRLVCAQGTGLDRGRLRQRAAARDAEDALRSLLALERRGRRRAVPAEEVERWAQRGP
jgi:hypothetical protein